jgi:hypothetical protein
VLFLAHNAIRVSTAFVCVVCMSPYSIKPPTAPNTPNLNSPLVSQRRIRLRVDGVSGAGSAWNVSCPAARERHHPVMNTLSDTARDQPYETDAAREQLGRCPVDLSIHTVGRARCHGHRPVKQRDQLVGPLTLSSLSRCLRRLNASSMRQRPWESSASSVAAATVRAHRAGSGAQRPSPGDGLSG